jgi:hypothetical protein
MSLLRGEDLNIGIGIENPSARGTLVDPQAFIPGRTPTGINVEVVKTLIKETKASGVSSQGSVVVQRKASGSLEFNLRSESIGYLLKSLLGKCTTTVVSGSVKSHKFEVLPNNPQFPTVSLALAQAGSFQDYAYKNALVKSLEIKTPVDDLVNATVEFIASDEEEHAAHTVAFNDTDYHFRPQDVSIKIAADKTALAAASAINVKEFSVSQNNNGKAQQHIGSVTPTDNIAGLLEIAGEMVLDYEGKTYHDLFKNGTYQALEITLERTDITYSASYHPKIVITLAKVSIEQSSPDRPIDDIVKDKLSFVAHYDADESEAINITVQNTVADYDYDVVS